MMKIWIASLFAVVMILSACSKEDTKTTAEPASMQEVHVTYITSEKNPNNKPVLFQVEVMQEGEKVDDASSVQFEYWKSGDRDHSKMVEAKSIEKGIYEAEAKLDNDSVYYAYAHTEARGLHVMPKGKFIIGNPDMKKVKEEPK